MKFLSTLFLCTSLSLAYAQTPFPACNGKHFAVLSRKYTEPSQLFQVRTDPNTGGTAFELLADVKLNGQGVHMNALAFNNVDGYLYGMNDNTNSGRPTLYRVDAAGNATVVKNFTNANDLPPSGGPLTLSAVFGFVGTTNTTGKYYFPAANVDAFGNNYRLYLGTLDLTNPSGTPTYTLITMTPATKVLVDQFVLATRAYIASGGTGTEPEGGPQDWAINPNNENEIWSFLGIERVVFKLDLSTMLAETFTAPSSNTNTNEFGGIFFDDFGELYGMDVMNGKAYRIDISDCDSANPQIANCGTFKTTLVSTLPTIPIGDPTRPDAVQLRGDMASCLRVEALPVTMSSFTGKVDGCVASLNWTTETEENNDYFILEKSTDGVQFAAIGRIDGFGTTNAIQNYSFEDEKADAKNYYRLKQVDFDGKVNYISRQVFLRSNCFGQGNNGFVGEAFPNPTTGAVTLKFYAQKDETAQLVVTNLMGQVVLHNTIPLQADANMINTNLQNLPNGLYSIRLYGEKWYSDAKKIVKID